jgi:hypothetical protein
MTLAVEWSRGIEDGWSAVATFIPKLLGFLVILVIGYLVVKAIAKIADRVLERVGFDRAVERGGIKQAMARSKYDASTVVSKIIFYALFLVVLQLAFGVFGQNPVSDLIAGVIAYLPKVLAAIAIIVVLSAVAAAARTLIQSTLGGLSYGQALANVAAGAIIAVGVFMALNQLEIAPAIVNGLFYATLALVVGSGIIAIGGGGIRPMQQVWERAMTRVEEEAPRVREHAEANRRHGSDRHVDLTAGEADDGVDRTTVQERVAGTHRSTL